MKSVLVVASAAAMLLLGSLAYWNTRPARTSAPEIYAQENPRVLESAPVDLEAAEPMRSLESPPITRSEAEIPPAVEPRLEADMANRSGARENEALAKKYAGVSAADRSAAMEAIRLRLGRDLLDAAEIVSLGNELEWLRAHEKP